MCINGHKKTHKGHSWRLMSQSNYTRPDNSELRKAAEEIESRLRNAGLEHDADYLRAALEGK
jgi:predicted RNase H-like nuclease (RuvC/YqgF family)